MTNRKLWESQRFLRELRRNHLVSYVAKVFETVVPGEEFVANWHLDAIAWELEQLENRRARRLLVTMPPRHLKSIMISVAWVTWMLGRFPTRRFVCVSYSNDLAADHARMRKAVMQSDWYVELFPRAKLAGQVPVMDLRTTAGGRCIATSVTGTLTGRGGECIVIDDPIKPIDALSPVMRENCINWYSNTLVTRLNRQETGQIVLVMQRIHEEDLAGHVLKEGTWRHLNLPAVAVEPDRVQIGPDRFYLRTVGAPLNPEHTSLEAFQILRAAMGSEMFDGQFQQQAIPTTGLLFKRGWMRFYGTAPKKEPGDLIVQAWDTASSENITADFSACVTALVRGTTVYVLDVFRGRLEFPRLLAKTIAMAERWQVDALLIEDAASGRELITSLRHSGSRHAKSPIARAATVHKEARAWGQTALVERGDLIIPHDAPWLSDFLHELLSFPRGKHDDRVDALVHLLGWASDRRCHVTMNAGPELVHPGSEHANYEPALDERDPWGAY